jgi:2-deoxy-D-gluconate 3-dehydrogenase
MVIKMSNITDFSLDVFRLDGKAAIVTGANQGLGIGYAYAFACAGADIFIPHLTDDVSQVKELVESCGKRVCFLQGDLTDPSHIDSIVSECITEFGKIDILVNNAGMNYFEDIMGFPDEAWKKVIDVNLNSVYYLGSKVGRHMAKFGRGKIINIASALSFTADKMCPPYVASKHAIIGITRDFANEFGAYNVQCNALAPGFLATNVNKDILSGEFMEKITSRIPAGRWGEVYDLMGTAVFLASPASNYINGWTVSVDGGFTTTL